MKTDKQQYIELFTTLMVQMIKGDTRTDISAYDISKDVFLSALANQEIGAQAAEISKKGYMNDREPTVNKYFFEVCELVGADLDLEHHYTSYNWYHDKKKNIRENLETLKGTKRYVVGFANGRRGKTAGVRFVKEKNDKLFTVATANDVDSTNKAVATRDENLKKKLNSGLIEPTMQKEKLESLDR